MGSVTFNVESIFNLRAEIEPLWERQFVEMEIGDEGLAPLSPDWGGLGRAERAGQMMLVIAREGGQLVGYEMFFIVRPWYADALVAICGGIWLDYRCRKGGTGLRLMDYSDKILNERGVVKTKRTAKIGTQLDKILIRLGYQENEHHYVR